MVHDPTDLASIPARTAARDRMAHLARLAEIDEVRRVMSGPPGRAFVHRLLDHAGVFRLSIQRDGSELTHATAFAEGRRSEGLRIWTIVAEHCLGEWQKAVEEARIARAALEAQGTPNDDD